MTITDVQTVLLTGPCTHDPYLTEARQCRSAAFIEISTDTDLVGLGETYAGYFCPEIVPSIVDFFKPILIGCDVVDPQALWQRMYHCGNFWCRVGLGLVVLNGIEAALWDLLGKRERKPVYELLGGRQHERLKAYASGGPSNYPLDRLDAKIDYYLSLGFTGFKIGAGAFWKDRGFEISAEPESAAEFEASKLSHIRERLSDDIAVMLDGHMGNSPDRTWDLATAKAVVEAVAPYQLLFFEEPLHYTDPMAYAELSRSSPVPIAGGECLTGTCEWQTFIERDCFHIGQPDASFTGGMGQFVQVASLLNDRGRSIATHAWGAGGSLMQNVHAGFACSNTIILEVPPAYGPLHSDIMKDSFQMKSGYVLPPDCHGLGIVLSNELRNRYPFVPGSGEFNSVPGKILPEELPSFNADKTGL